MATDEPTPTPTDGSSAGATQFGRVSRRVGTAFRWFLLASTLLGIVALGVLLLYVTYVATQPLTADPGWYLVYGVALVAPALATGAWFLRTNRSAGRFGVSVVGGSFVATLVTGGLLAVFVDVLSPIAFLAYALALALPVAVVVALQRRAHRISFAVRLFVAGATTVLSLWLVPRFVFSVRVLPSDWLILVVTLGLPIGVLVGRSLPGQFGDALPTALDRALPDSLGEGRADVVAGVVVLAGAFAAGPAGVAAGIGGVAAVLLWLGLVVPVGTYATRVAVLHPERRTGLAIPAVLFGGTLLGTTLVDVLGFAGPQTWLDWQFLTTSHSNTATQAGVYPAIVGTILLMVIVTVASFPIGVGAAIYLEEYAPDTTFTRIIDVNISNLAGVPSIVYGLLGLGAFVRYGWFSIGTVLVGGMTLALLILPIVIISSREAIRAVPDSQREAAYGMGATRWQTVRSVVVPRAFPGILTGTILALGRAVGETAPLLVIGAPAVFNVPTELSDPVGALPLQIYTWAGTYASEAFYTTALAAGVVTLLVVMLTMNSLAIVLRNRFEREQY